MFSLDQHIKFCRFIKWAMLTCTGFPQLDRKSARQLCEFLDEAPRGIKTASWFASEVKEYAATITSKPVSRTVAAFVLVNLLIIGKYSYHALLMWLELDFNYFERNIKSLGQSAKFLCLLTNCTQLSNEGGNLAADLKHVPIFSLCHTSLSIFFSPVSDLGSFAILMDCYVCHYLIFACVIFPVHQIWNKSNIESLMFIVSPNLTISLLRNQLDRMYKTYLCSSAYSSRPSRAGELNLERYHGASQKIEYLESVARTRRVIADCQQSKSLRTRGLQANHGLSNYWDEKPPFLRQAFIDECLPAVRTSWWRTKAANLYFNTFLWLGCLAFVCLILIYINIITKTNIHMRARLLNYDKFMLEERCAIWYEDNDHDRENGHATIKLADLDVAWTLRDFIDTVLPVLWTICILMSLISSLFVIICELKCWLKEVRHNLLVLTDLVRVWPLILQDYCMDRKTSARMSALAERRADLRAIKPRLSLIRDLFIEHTKLKLFLVENVPLGSVLQQQQQQQQKQRKPPGDELGVKLNSTSKASSQVQIRIARDLFAHEMLFCTAREHEHHLNFESTRAFLIELTGKIYLNHQLLLKMVSMSSTNIAALMFQANLGGFGTALIALFLSRVARDVSQLAYAFVVVTLFGVIFIIALVSSFHAGARKLQPLFWSLVAQLKQHASEEPELLRLRQLLVNQTSELDRNGGLAMSAYSFRVTYTNVIELFLWSSTILMLTLKDH